jgi:predicted nucleic acid-binding protein
VRFWDSSAILPLLVREKSSPAILEILGEDRDMAVWWATEIECVSALMRLERQKQIAAEPLDLAIRRLREFAEDWHEVAPVREIREAAKRFLRLHPLSAADSLQLAAAFAVSENDPASLELVTLDSRLRDAASRQGFSRILPNL